MLEGMLMLRLNKRLYTILLGIAAILLLCLSRCSGSPKPLEQRLIGTWQDTATDRCLSFYADGSMLEKQDHLDTYDWYYWEVINESIVELDGVRYYTTLQGDTLVLADQPQAHTYAGTYIRDAT